MHFHIGVKPKDYGVCGKQVIQAQILKEHMLIHTCEKPHACDICGLHFRQAQHLKEHIYTGVKPHDCGVRCKQFIQA